MPDAFASSGMSGHALSPLRSSETGILLVSVAGRAERAVGVLRLPVLGVEVPRRAGEVDRRRGRAERRRRRPAVVERGGVGARVGVADEQLAARADRRCRRSCSPPSARRPRAPRLCGLSVSAITVVASRPRLTRTVTVLPVRVYWRDRRDLAAERVQRVRRPRAFQGHGRVDRVAGRHARVDADGAGVAAGGRLLVDVGRVVAEAARGVVARVGVDALVPEPVVVRVRRAVVATLVEQRRRRRRLRGRRDAELGELGRDVGLGSRPATRTAGRGSPPRARSAACHRRPACRPCPVGVPTKISGRPALAYSRNFFAAVDRERAARGVATSGTGTGRRSAP